VFCFLLAAVTGCAKQKIKNIDSKGTDIICFGDSMTFGYGANSGEDYPSALIKRVNLPIINAGVDGDTSNEGIKRLSADVLEKSPLLVIIEFGGNDFLKKIPLDVTVNNIKEMIDKIHARGSMIALVDVSAGMILQDYRQEFYKIAKQKGVIFIPGVLNGIITTPQLKSDFLHPNGKGYDLIAERVYRAIKPYLKRNN
jgi:lysophospholipase L1-like esterase